MLDYAMIIMSVEPMKTGFHWQYYKLTMLTANDMFEL